MMSDEREDRCFFRKSVVKIQNVHYVVKEEMIYWTTFENFN